mmetsp:Transcript_5899/g.9807  ORF Transcript_5899/g.9807 Transcript_5899/m.9807 type:complete len:201 (+) Transcript_5899:108-710(+)
MTSLPSNQTDLVVKSRTSSISSPNNSPPKKCSCLKEMNQSTLSLLDLTGSVLQMGIDKHQQEQEQEQEHTNQQKQKEQNQKQRNTTATRLKKSVKFGGLLIHEHSLTIGDLPWKDGPPVALSWEQVALKHLDLDEFEESREGERRQQKDLHTTAAHRRTMLKAGGYSDSDLLRAEKLKKAISLSRSWQPNPSFRRSNSQR